jgi:endonuclease-8
VSQVSDEEAMAIIAAIRPRMAHSALHGRMDGEPRVFRRHGRPCARCGGTVVARGQGDDNRTTFWCPVCQL